MYSKTYLKESFRNGRIMRWTSMPLKVYIAPMQFYSKAGEDYLYRDMIIRALNVWEKASGGKVSFTIVNTLLDSQINVAWKRVERTALGHCMFEYDAMNRLFGAEVQIGLSDGIIHKDYMDKNEVYHTILHEIGHAIGLGHSPCQKDIMYTPHRYGIVALSDGDILTLQWLYKLSVGAAIDEISAKFSVPSNDIDYIIQKVVQNAAPSEFEQVKNSIKSPQKDLLEEAQNIADLKKYNIALQDIKISDDIRKLFIYRNNK